MGAMELNEHDEPTARGRAIDAIRARWRTPGARAEEHRARGRVRGEIPPARPSLPENQPEAPKGRPRDGE